MNTKVMNAFEDKEASYSVDVSFRKTEETSVNMSEDFENMTYDNHFKMYLVLKEYWLLS